VRSRSSLKASGSLPIDPVCSGFAAPTRAAKRTGWGLASCPTQTRWVPARTCSATVSWVASRRSSSTGAAITPTPPKPRMTAGFADSAAMTAFAMAHC
jgi:hypothetical protein